MFAVFVVGFFTPHRSPNKNFTKIKKLGQILLFPSSYLIFTIISLSGCRVKKPIQSHNTFFLFPLIYLNLLMQNMEELWRNNLQFLHILNIICCAYFVSISNFIISSLNIFKYHFKSLHFNTLLAFNLAF